MPLVEIDGLNRIDDMSYELDVPGGGTGNFRPGRITLAEVGGQDFLVAGGENGGGVGVALIEPRGGLSYLDTYGAVFRELDDWEFKSSSIASFETSEGTFIYLSGDAEGPDVVPGPFNQRGLTVLELDETGDLDFVEFQALDRANFGGGTVSSFGVDPQFVTVGGKDLLVTTYSDREASEQSIATYKVRADGTLKLLDLGEPNASLEERYELVKVGGKAFMVTFGRFDVAPMQVYQIKKSGDAVLRFEVTPDETAIFNRITSDMATAEVDGRTYVFVSEVTDGSILVFELKKSGELVLLEQEDPGRFDGWSSPEAMVTFEQDGRTYLATGGYGNGLGVFEVSSGGALTEVDEFTFSDSLVRYVYDLEVTQLSDGTYLFPSMAGGDELRSFRFVTSDERMIYGNGRNTVEGTEEDDQILTRGGNDTVRAGLGDDLVEGGNGKDRLYGDEGDDNLYGGDKNDRIWGGADDDYLFGDAGNDQLRGQLGNDYARGGGGNDKLWGDDGFDRLYGDNGRDTLKGGAGNDSLSDGAGRDILVGGSGGDTFVLSVDKNRDVITDYEDELDKIDLTDMGPDLEFSDLEITQSGSDVLVGYGNDTVLVKAADGDLQVFELSLGDFIFAA